KRKLVRLMEIRKMRGNEINIGEIPFTIGVPDIISFRMPPDLKSIPSGIMPEKGYIDIIIGQNKISLVSGTQNVFLANPSIDTLSFITSILLPSIMKNKLRIHYRSYMHGERTIIDALTRCIKNHLDLYKEGLNNLFIRNLNPTSRSIIDLELIAEAIEKIEKPDIIIIEGLGNYIDFVADKETYKEEHYNNLVRRAVNNVTGFYFINSYEKDLMEIPLINVYDNVFYLDINQNKLILKSIRNHLRSIPMDPIEIDINSLEKCLMV
ncbi:MAG: RAD55 family ATPase, partial [Caldisphaera sp.]